MSFALVVLFYGGFALISGLLADSRGRSPIGWAFLGFFFNIFALIALIVLPDEEERHAYRKQQATETRRLRERLRKDRQTSDRRHEETTRRIDQHDRAIGLNTGSQRGSTLGDASAAAISAATPPPIPEARSVRQSLWYYAHAGKTSPPSSFSDVEEKWDEGVIELDTLLWRDGMEDWLPLAQITDLRGELGA